MKVGDVVSWERTFTVEDVRRFAEYSGDEGVHHLEPDEKGRLMVHGLLTATLPTKVGGDINFIARQVRSEEHTSELQSRQYHVCRLLLEKKNVTTIAPT